MPLLLTAMLFLALAGVMMLIGSRLWVRPKAAMDRVTGTEFPAQSAPPHPSLVFRGLVAKIGSLAPASPKDVTVIQRRLIRAGYRNPGALKNF